MAAVDALLGDGEAATAATDWGDTALHWAAACGHVDVVRRLLDAGADVAAPCGSWWWWTDDEQPLHWAAGGGQAAAVRVLLDAGAEVAARNTYGETALWLAARSGSAATVRVLLDAGADARVADRSGCTVLYAAGESGSVEAVRTLVAAGVDVTSAIMEGRAVLCAAAWGGSAEVVSELIAAGADVSAQDRNGRTALHYASLKGSADTVQVLLSAGADVHAKDRDRQTALHCAGRGGNAAIVRQLLHAGAKLVNRRDGETPLHAAGRGGSAEAVRMLVAAGADVRATDCNGRTPLHVAASGRGGASVIEALVAAGADVRATDRYNATALTLLRGREFATAARVLLAAGADAGATDRYGNTVLHAAARCGDAAGVRLAMAVSRCEVDVVNGAGETALHLASQNGNVECVETLLAEGADARVKATDGQTAMHKVRTSQLVAVLQATGADVNAKDKRGRTVLHCAAGNLSPFDLISALLAAGAKARAADNGGQTALHCAAASLSPAAVRVLLAADADVTAVDDDGETCLHWAMKHLSSYNRLAGVMVSTLLRAGAKPGARDKRGQTPLHGASRGGFLTAASLLLGDPLAWCADARRAAADAPAVAPAKATHTEADVNAANQDGQTALHLAALEGDSRMVALLLRHGAHPTPVNVSGGTPLTAAAALGHAAIVTQLPAEHPPGAVSTPAHEAAAARRPAMLSLPPIAAFLPARDEAGNTVLHVAGRRADRPTVVAALGSGVVDVRARNAADETALSLVLAWIEKTAADAQLLRWLYPTPARNDDRVMAVVAGRWFRTARTAGDAFGFSPTLLRRLTDARGVVMALLNAGARLAALGGARRWLVMSIVASTQGFGRRQALLLPLRGRLRGRNGRGEGTDEEDRVV